MAGAANRAHCRSNPRKERSRRELSERLDVGRPEMFGGFSSEHFWIDGSDCGPAEGAAAQRPIFPERCSSLVRGVDHEQCSEPAVYRRARSATERRLKWTGLVSVES